MTEPYAPPAFTALLFGLSGCLVDFGARSVPVALQRCYPDHRGAAASLEQVLGRAPSAKERQAFEQTLIEVAAEHAEATPGALDVLHQQHAQQVPCAWLDELPRDASVSLASALPTWLPAASNQQCRPWPAPDACWQALKELQVDRLDGCVLISGEPRLLEAGLKAGLWTVGLAACGPLCGQAPADWEALPTEERDQLRTQATLALYRLGVHSVIDHLLDLGPCLDDLAARRHKGEKP